jgi:hypothetical protein
LIITEARTYTCNSFISKKIPQQHAGYPSSYIDRLRFLAALGKWFGLVFAVFICLVIATQFINTSTWNLESFRQEAYHDNAY